MKWFRCLILGCNLILLIACGAPRNLFVLVPDAEDGSVGEIVVTNDAGEQTITAADTVVRVKNARTAPTSPKRLAKEELQSIFQSAIAATPRPPDQFILQFITGSSELTSASQLKLPRIVSVVTQRQPCDVRIIGHTDSLGPAALNVELGLERANRVKQILIDQGVGADQIEATSRGENDPLIPTADNVNEPRNRRVEVWVR